MGLFQQLLSEWPAIFSLLFPHQTTRLLVDCFSRRLSGGGEIRRKKLKLGRR